MLPEQSMKTDVASCLLHKKHLINSVFLTVRQTTRYINDSG